MNILTKIETSNQTGMTLVEIMVAMAISLMLLAGIVQLFMSNKVTYNTQNNLGRVQENGRYALEILEQNIMMAGYTQNIMNTFTPFTNATLDNAYPNDPYDADLTEPKDTITTTTANKNASDQIEIVTDSSDCLSNTSVGNETSRFYIGISGGGYNLMCKGSSNANPQPIIEGIENMQIQYGEDTDDKADGIPNIYRNAENVANWSRITSVKIALLVSSLDESAPLNTNTYALLDAAPIGPVNDHRLRRVFTKTIKIRN